MERSLDVATSHLFGCTIRLVGGCRASNKKICGLNDFSSDQSKDLEHRERSAARKPPQWSQESPPVCWVHSSPAQSPRIPPPLRGQRPRPPEFFICWKETEWTVPFTGSRSAESGQTTISAESPSAHSGIKWSVATGSSIGAISTTALLWRENSKRR